MAKVILYLALLTVSGAIQTAASGFFSDLEKLKNYPVHSALEAKVTDFRMDLEQGRLELAEGKISRVIAKFS